MLLETDVVSRGSDVQTASVVAQANILNDLLEARHQNNGLVQSAPGSGAPHLLVNERSRLVRTARAALQRLAMTLSFQKYQSKHACFGLFAFVGWLSVAHSEIRALNAGHVLDRNVCQGRRRQHPPAARQRDQRPAQGEDFSPPYYPVPAGQSASFCTRSTSCRFSITLTAA
jgi:hypothetical protein